jgi:SAM-dependent methyltransferase
VTWQENYVDRFYKSRDGWLDGTTEFHELCRRLAPSGSPKILEVGSGPSNPTSHFLASLGELHGLDVSEEVKTNEALKSAHVVEGDAFPFESGFFDLCVSNYVLEHVPDPVAHLREVARVLKPGGAFAFRTPNRLHYVSLVASLTPHWFHELVANRLRNLPEGAHDPYRCFTG